MASRPFEIQDLVHIDVKAPAVLAIGVRGIGADQVLVARQRQGALINRLPGCAR